MRHVHFLNAAAAIRTAITELRRAGLSEQSGLSGRVVADLERIHGVCVANGKAEAQAETVTAEPVPVPSPVTAPKVETAPAKPQAETARPKTVAQTAPAPKAVAPKAKPKTGGLEAYRKLQEECKALGLSPKGKADELKARLAAAQTAPKAEAQTARPAVVAPETVTLTVEKGKADLLGRLAQLPADTLAQLLALAQ